MTIIANNNVNSGNSTLSLGPSVLNSADGVGLTGNFLDIIFRIFFLLLDPIISGMIYY